MKIEGAPGEGRRSLDPRGSAGGGAPRKILHPHDDACGLALATSLELAILCRMAAKITIAFSDEVLRAMRKGAPIRLAMASAEGASPRAAAPKRRGGRGKKATPREGSLPARLAAFANSVGKTFTTAHVSKAFKLSRAHASMLLSKAVASGVVRREGRGVYAAR